MRPATAEGEIREQIAFHTERGLQRLCISMYAHTLNQPVTTLEAGFA